MTHDAINVGYARALFELATAEGVADRVEEELFRLREMLKVNPAVLEFLKEPNIKREGKRQALAELFEGRVHPVLLGWLMSVTDHDRAHRLRAIMEEYSGVVAAARERVSGEILTATALDEAAVERIAREMSRITGKNVQLFQKVDSSILGGALIKVGEQVIDSSLRRKLHEIKDQMVRS